MANTFYDHITAAIKAIAGSDMDEARQHIHAAANDPEGDNEVAVALWEVYVFLERELAATPT